MDDLNSDLILHITQYVNVLDAAAWMQTSKRYYYLIHQLRRVLGPEMVVAATTPFVLTALQKVRQPPTLALCCQTEYVDTDDNEQIAAQLPPTTVVLGAVSSHIQTCLDGDIESTSPSNILLGHLGHEATVIQPFLWQAPSQPQPGRGGRRRHMMEWDAALEQEVKDAFSNSSGYEVFILYGCGAGCNVLEEFIECVQSMHPKAALVGGICSSGFVSKPVDASLKDAGILSSKSVRVLKQMYKSMGGSASFLATLTEKQTLVEHVLQLLHTHPYVLEPNVEDGVFGVALGGNVPIRSVVSRGVKQLTPPDTTLVAKEVRTEGPTIGQDLHPAGAAAAPPTRIVVPAFHVVESIIDKDTGKEWNVLNFLASHGEMGVDFCGVRRRRRGNNINNNNNHNTEYEDSFELYQLDVLGDKLKISSDHINTDVSGGSAEEEDSLQDAQLDFFALDGPSCMKHVETTMRQLKEQTTKAHDSVMAAIMFSCSGRGPMPGWLMSKRMADAHAFSNAFGGNVPCIGFYAGGEIGPLATAPAPDHSGCRDLFQRGKAALQGFTAVFALFVAPIVDLKNVDIDDSPTRVEDFIIKQLAV